MNRRGFLQSILIAGVAPAIVRAESLMAGVGLVVPMREIILPSQGIIVPTMGRGGRILTVYDATSAHSQALADGLIPLRRYISARGAQMVDFDMPRPAPRWTGKTF